MDFFEWFAEANVYIVLASAALLIILIIFFVIFVIYYIKTRNKNTKINPDRPQVYEKEPSETSRIKSIDNKNRLKTLEEDDENESESDEEEKVHETKINEKPSKIKTSTPISTIHQNNNQKKVNNQKKNAIAFSSDYDTDPYDYKNSPVINKKKEKQQYKEKRNQSPISTFVDETVYETTPKNYNYNRNNNNNNNNKKVINQQQYNEKRNQSPISTFVVDESVIETAPKNYNRNNNNNNNNNKIINQQQYYKNPLKTENDKMKLAKEVRRASPDLETGKY